MAYPDSDTWDVHSFVAEDGLASTPTGTANTRGVDADCVPRMLEDMLAARTVPDACRVAADRIQKHLGVELAAIGLTRSGRAPCRLAGLSQLESFDNRSPWIRALEGALDEAALRDRIGSWPAAGDDGHGLLAHQGFCRVTGSDWVVSAPIRRTDQRVLAILLVAGTAQTGSHAALGFARAGAGRLAGCLQTLVEARQSTWARCVSGFRSFVRQRRVSVAAAIVALVFGVLWIPVPYKIPCDVELQPVVRRFVAAPFDGTLEKSLVAPGEVVERDQRLARMDEREIRWELAGLNFEWNRASKERDAAMAQHQVGAAQLANLEMQRLEVRIEMLENRARNLDISSPIAGIIVAGDLEKAQGAPLSVGQTLFEVAPLDAMIVELAVPEREIGFVTPGMPVTVRLDAYGRRRFEGRVARIHPRAELRGDQSVFVAEFELPNPDRRFRPGMNGHAKLVARPRPLGWNLFHRAWESLLEKLGW